MGGTDRHRRPSHNPVVLRRCGVIGLTRRDDFERWGKFLYMRDGTATHDLEEELKVCS